MEIHKKLIDFNKFSPTEQTIARYLISKKEQVLKMSIRQIAKETFSSPSTIVRFCRKLGTNGFREFKILYSAQLMQNTESITDIDYNVPFSQADSYLEISKKLCELHCASVTETYHLLSNKTLEEAVDLITSSKRFFVFYHGHGYTSSLSFQNKLLRININPLFSPIQSEQYHLANQTDDNDCSLIISYNGNKTFPNEIRKILEKRGSKIIAITANNESVLSKGCNLLIPLPFYEDSYTRLTNFSSQTSIDYVLNVLYSCLFKEHYRNNLELNLESERVVKTVKEEKVIPQ